MAGPKPQRACGRSVHHTLPLFCDEGTEAGAKAPGPASWVSEAARSIHPPAECPLRGYCPHTKLHLLGKESTKEKLQTLGVRINNECLSDLDGVTLYVSVGTESRPK